jgi:hypothetical protein
VSNAEMTFLRDHPDSPELAWLFVQERAGRGESRTPALIRSDTVDISGTSSTKNRVRTIYGYNTSNLCTRVS